MDVPHLMVSENIVPETVVVQQSAPTSAPLAEGEENLPQEEIIQTTVVNNVNAAPQLPKENGQVSQLLIVVSLSLLH